MGIGHYIKEIGRGRDGARALKREQAADLMGQVLDGQVSDLEVGAFCLAMRIKGETAEEMAGFLDATHARLHALPVNPQANAVVLPCYNGARKLPVLTPLLAHLLAREGMAVIMHGTATEASRISSQEVLASMGVTALSTTREVQAGEVVFAPTELLCPSLKRLLDVRRVVGLRNPAHSLVKLMNPVQNNATQKVLRISSYTHPEYLHSMAATFALTQARALLLRGTEGEVVADARRQPQMDIFVDGQRKLTLEAQSGSLKQLPELPTQIDAHTTASYTQAVLNGTLPVPAPIAQQVQAALQALSL
jgi:anthranilate phosphoribosyltransferase